jgi:DNA repair exonuclease SbcCD ATPase subunit
VTTQASPTGADLDDSIENLQRFNGLLADTVARLQSDQEALESHGGALDRLEDAAGQELGSLGASLESHQASLDAAAEDAEKALAHLEEEAAAVSDTRLAATDDALDRRGEALEGELSASAGELDGKASDLTTAGFAPALADLSEAESAAQSEQSEVEQALEELESAVDAARDAARSAGEDVSGAVGEFAADANAQQATAAEVGQLAAYAADTFGPDLEAAVDEYVDSVDQAYEDVGEAVLEGASEDASDVAGLLSDAAHRLEDQTLKDLEEAVEETAGPTLERLLGELRQVEALLGVGADTTEAAAALIPDLATSQAVIAEIDRLLNTLES